MALKFRRGTTAQKSGSLAFGEPFVNTDLQTLQIGLDGGDVELVSKDDFNTFTSSVDSAAQTVRIDQLAAATASINAFTASQLTKDSTLATVTSSLQIETANLESFSASAILRLNSLETDTGSQNTRISVLETKASTLATVTSSLQIETSNLETFSASAIIRLTNIESTTSSINSLNTTQTSRLDQLSTFTASNGNTSLNSYTASNDTTNNAQTGRLNNLETTSASLLVETSNLETFSASAIIRLTNIESTTASLATTYEGRASGAKTLISGSSQLSGTTIPNLSGSFTGSFKGNLAGVADYSSLTAVSSVGTTTDTTLYPTFTTNILAGNYSSLYSHASGSFYYNGVTRQVNAEGFVGGIYATNGVISGSAQLPAGLVSGSSQLTSSYDSRYVTLDGTQTINGTKTFNDIVVNGTGSFAYITSVSGNAKIIGDSFIVLNTDTPTSRYAGISVYDSGSTLSTASFYYDGQTNDWGYEYSSSTGIDYAVTIFGPEYTTKGTPTYLTTNKVPKAVDNHHLNDSNITDTGTLITLGSNTVVNGTLVASGTTLVSSSAQIVGILASLNSYTASNDTTNNTQNSRLDQLSTDSGSQNTRITTLETKATTLASVTSSLQIETANLETFSASALIRLNNLETTTSSLATTYEGRASGAKTLFSGSSQVNYTQLSGISANIISASADSSTVDFTITGGSISANLIGGVVSGSSQVSYIGLSNIPAGIVSGSSQVNFTQLAGISANIISASTDSSTVDFTISGGSITANLIGGVVSGSSQVVGILASLNSFTASNGNTSLNSFTASNGNTSLNSYTSSATIRLNNLESTTASLATTYEGRASGAKTLFSGSSQVTLSSTTGGGTAASVQFGSLGIGTAASGVTGEIRATADITAYYSSDIRLKENIRPIDNALDKIRKISGNTYDWKDGFEEIHSHKGEDIGVIAQEVEAVLPILVTTREHGYKAVQYEKIVALLIEGIKEQQLQIEQLRIDLDNCRNNKGL